MDPKSPLKITNRAIGTENNSNKLQDSNRLLRTKKVSKLLFKTKFKNKPNSLKEEHFQKFFNSIINKASPYILLNNNNNIPKSNLEISDNNLKFIEANYKTLSKNILKNNAEYYSTINNKKEKEPKNRKIIKFYKIYKAPQFRNINDIDKECIIPNKKSVIEIKSLTPSYRQRFNKNIFINSPSNKDTSPKKMKLIESIKSPEYNPSRITNKFLDLFEENENDKKNIPSFSKTYNNFKDFKYKNQNNLNVFKNENKHKCNCSMTSRKNTITNQDKEIFYCRKEKSGFPYLFESSVIFNNEYENKSEKNRHGIIIDGLNKLKYEMELNPDQKINFLKEFLYKYHLKNFMEYSDEQLLFLSKLICQKDNKNLISLLKPHFKTQDMLLDLINNVDLMKQKDNNSKDKSRNLTKEKSTNDIINEELDMDTLKTNINDKKIFRSINDNIFSENNNMKSNKGKNCFSKTEQSFYNKKKRQKNSNTLNFHTFYNSPFYKPHISRFSNVSTRNNLNDKKTKNSRFRKLDLSETSSQLKDLNFQKKLLNPEKEYCSNYKLLLNDVHIEIEAAKNKYNKVMEGDGILSIKKINSIGENKKNSRRYTEGFLFNTQVEYRRCKKLLNSEMRKIQKDKADLAKNKKSNLKDVNKRLYYVPIKYHFGYEQIKDEHKLTEMVAFNFAKKKLKDIQDKKEAKEFFGNLSIKIK